MGRVIALEQKWYGYEERDKTEEAAKKAQSVAGDRAWSRFQPFIGPLLGILALLISSAVAYQIGRMGK